MVVSYSRYTVIYFYILIDTYLEIIVEASMSVLSSPSQKSKANVKISKLTRCSTMSSRNPKFSKMTNTRTASNACCETLDKIQSRRPTLRVESKSHSYEKLRISSSLQFFRDDWGGVTAIRYVPDTEKIAVGFNSGDLVFCSITPNPHRTGPYETILKGWEGNDSISCIQFHPKRPTVMFAASSAGTVVRRDLEDTSNYNDQFISEEANEIYSMDFTADCHLVTAGRDTTVKMYDVTKERLIREFGIRCARLSDFDSMESSWSDEFCHQKRIYSVRCHPGDPAVMVSGGWDGVKVWDSRTPAAVRSIPGPFICGDAVDMCSGKILTGSCVASNCLQLWDLGSGFLIDNVDPPNKRVYLYGEYPYVTRFHKGDPSGDLILYGVGGLQLISIQESSVLYLFEDEKPVSAVDSIEKKIFFGGKSHSLLTGKMSFPESDISSSSVSYASGMVSDILSDTSDETKSEKGETE